MAHLNVDHFYDEEFVEMSAIVRKNCLICNVSHVVDQQTEKSSSFDIFHRNAFCSISLGDFIHEMD